MTGKQAAAVILLMLVLIAVTRGLCLTHNMFKHPDEHVFFLAADNLASCWLGEAEEYEEVKEYPEGAIVLQAPFHAAAHIAAQALHKTTDPLVLGRLSGRAAAVFYFSAGACMGALVLWRFLSRRRSALAIYAATIVFSLMHLEQSRYGTGDAVSFCLLMVIVLLSALSLNGGKRPAASLAAAFFLSGLLCAVKYPQLLFVCIPAAAAGRYLKGKPAARKTLLVMAAIIFTAAGFLLFSPKVLSDPQ